MFEAIVRYGAMLFIDIASSEIQNLSRSEKVILRTQRGLELGEVVTLPTEVPEGTQREISVIRKATKEDLECDLEIHEVTEPQEFKVCQEKIRFFNLPMRLASVEHLFGGEKIVFYFLAESRVDFRELVKELAREYRTRIEMKQIGARDQAKLLSDIERCGRELCCRKFIRSLEPVTIKMAKNQKATLDPAKISGACGRLMCCLRFEHKVYAELKTQMPRKGQVVSTPDGESEVINYDIIAQTVTVELKGEQKTYPLDKISFDKAKSLALEDKDEMTEEEEKAINNRKIQDSDENGE
ncbi:MAG: regulatory iron-sulfur-containing complex subunit RicT [Planctomycetota bacterium]